MGGGRGWRRAMAGVGLQHWTLWEPRHRSYHRLVPNPVLLPSGHGHVRGVCRPRGWRDDEAPVREAAAQMHKVRGPARRLTGELVAEEHRSDCPILSPPHLISRPKTWT